MVGDAHLRLLASLSGIVLATLVAPLVLPTIWPPMRRLRPGGRRQVRSFDSSSVMLLDFEVQRCTRRCAATDRALEPGDVCYSVLEVSGADVVRKDFCAEAWNGAPEAAFGWWKSRMPEPTAKKIKLAPNDVLLELFDQLADRPDQQDLRYVLTLLLVRRRVLRVDVAHGERRDNRARHWTPTHDEFEINVVSIARSATPRTKWPSTCRAASGSTKFSSSSASLLIAGAE